MLYISVYWEGNSNTWEVLCTSDAQFRFWNRNWFWNQPYFLLESQSQLESEISKGTGIGTGIGVESRYILLESESEFLVFVESGLESSCTHCPESCITAFYFYNLYITYYIDNCHLKGYLSWKFQVSSPDGHSASPWVTNFVTERQAIYKLITHMLLKRRTNHIDIKRNSKIKVAVSVDNQCTLIRIYMEKYISVQR